MPRVIAESVHFINEVLLANGTIAIKMLKPENSGNSCHNTKFAQHLNLTNMGHVHTSNIVNNCIFKDRKAKAPSVASALVLFLP